MVKKAVVSTVIFTLIIVNLIIWPTLFSDFKERNVEVSRDSSIDVEDESMESALDLDGEVDSELADEEVDIEEEKASDGSAISTPTKKVFKILRIE